MTIKNKSNFLNKFFIFSIIFLFTLQFNFDVDADHTTTTNNLAPEIFDDNYDIEKFADGFRYPTTMTFMDNQLLVLEKNTGKVFLVHSNGVREMIPILDLDVDYTMEGGLLGITAIENHVYLFFSQSQHGQDRNFQDDTTRDVLYQFTWNENTLSNPILIKSFDGSHYHKSGVLTTDGENYIYLIRGDGDHTTTRYPLQDPNYESGIFRISDSDLTIELYGTGIRNSFGMPKEKKFKAKLSNEYSKQKNFTHFARCSVNINEQGSTELKVLKGQQSNRIKPFVQANCWGIFSEGKEKFKSGDLIDWMPLNPNSIN